MNKTKDYKFKRFAKYMIGSISIVVYGAMKEIGYEWWQLIPFSIAIICLLIDVQKVENVKK